MDIHTIGIDLGKTAFHLVALNVRGEVVMRKTCSRAQLLRFTANRQVHLNWYGGMRGRSFSGSGIARAGT
jgi:hypothetical protein